MIGYCRLCNLRLDAPGPRASDVLPAGVERPEMEFFALAGMQLTHLQQHHADAFQTLLLLSSRFQAMVCGYLLDPPSETSLLLRRERDRVRQSLLEMLAQDDPVQVNRIQPATPAEIVKEQHAT
jgi:hypothetical protein